MSRRLVSTRLPDFPWDSLAAARERAAAHEGGLVDLSVGTPVDPTPALVRDALTAASDAPGYPTTIGTPALRRAFLGWLERRFDVTGLDVGQVLPSIGSKELIGSLALHLGLGPGDTIVVPELAYPTYAVGAALVGADVVVDDAPDRRDGPAPALVWVNSPANPHGAVLPPERLRELVRWAREHDVLLVSDECYLEFGWTGERPASVLQPDVNGGSVEGLLAVHSLSKRSNLAGYRGAFVVGDAAVVAELLEVRKNLGLQMPAPQQAACVAALDDDAHVDEQRARYRSRRERLRPALESAGFTIDHSEGSLYLWATRDEPCRDTVAWLAERGVLVAPGDFYGEAGARHVRVALTATDERIDAAVSRLT
ncbi:succinyldiaminopimelate transaminase [Solicola sp. PLA-1-18]|uniref:succinyldiaminopimelate transaminase n=1 Tax=Solicola sp. PLA-1-18 TaxID=3380532 RepID=UPI003B78C10A